jgi:hypothetical protein
MSLIAVITDPRSGHRTDPAEVRTILRRPKGGALRRLVKIGRPPPGLEASTLN